MKPITLNLTLLFLLAALFAFVFAICVAEAWFTLGTWQEWTAAGLGLRVLADIL